MSYLEQIIDTCQNRLNIQIAKVTQADLTQQLEKEVVKKYQPINIYTYLLKRKAHNNIIAEFKRASPSEGIINNDVAVKNQVAKYLVGNATGISILTQPNGFNGSLDDLEMARNLLELWKQSYHPVFLLRKDFIFSEYGLIESRIARADSVLLIVAVFKYLYKTETQIISHLQNMISLSRKYQMEPLVEIHNQEELTYLLKTDAKVIGINTRNLHTFKNDLTNANQEQSLPTTSNVITTILISQIPSDKVTIILSNIKTLWDIKPYNHLGVNNYLVGTSLMTAYNPSRHLVSLNNTPPHIKICGIQDLETARYLVETKVKLIGLIFAESTRKVNLAQAEQIIKTIRSNKNTETTRPELTSNRNKAYLTNIIKNSLSQKEFSAFQLEQQLNNTPTPLIVGVFKNQSVNKVNSIAEQLDLDLIQLHGNEIDHSFYSRPVIKTYSYSIDSYEAISSKELEENDFNYILFDTKVANTSGGLGKVFNHLVLQEYKSKMPYILAGGLNPDNIKNIINQTQPWIVDISSGVELDGKKNNKLIKRLIDKLT